MLVASPKRESAGSSPVTYAKNKDGRSCKLNGSTFKVGSGALSIGVWDQ